MYLLIALVLQATAPNAVAPPAAATETTAPTQQAPAATTQTTATPQTEVRCEWITPTGQRLRQRVCRTVNLIDERADLSADATRDMQGNRGVSQ